MSTTTTTTLPDGTSVIQISPSGEGTIVVIGDGPVTINMASEAAPPTEPPPPEPPPTEPPPTEPPPEPPPTTEPPTTPPDLTELPFLDEWKEVMRTRGKVVADGFDPSTFTGTNPKYGQYYQYDSAWSLFQIGDFLGDSATWDVYGHWAVKSERDAYWLPNNYHIQAILRHPHGLYESIKRNGGIVTIDDLRLMRDNPSYSGTDVFRDYGSGIVGANREVMTREIGYSAQTHILCERMGLARVTHPNDPNTPVIDDSAKPRLGWITHYQESHLHQWRTQTFINPDQNPRLSPFMVALCACTLIDWITWEEENGRDPQAYWPKDHWPTIQEALDDVFTWMRDEATCVNGAFEGQPLYRWENRPNYGAGNEWPAFAYQDRDNTTGSGDLAPGLNILIAPVYAWLYMRTGNIIHRQTVDDMYTAALKQRDWYYVGKRFNQHFRRWFQGYEWRRQGDLIHYGTPK